MKTIKKVVSVLVAVLLVAVMAVGTLTASAGNESASVKDFEEFKGTIAVLSNCDEGDKNQPGQIDPFVTSDNPDEIEGTATTPGKASGNISYSTEHFVQGTSAIKVHLTKDLTTAAKPACARTRFVIRQIEGVKVTDPNTTYLSFYMYCETAEDLKAVNWSASAVEVSEVSDSVEYQFGFTAIQQNNLNGNFVNGWNKIEIPLVKSKATGMNIKMFRFFLYSQGTKDVDVYIDNITLEKGDPFNTPATSSKPAVIGVPNASSKTSSAEETASTESADVSSEDADVTSTVEDTTVSETASVESVADDGSESEGIPVFVWVLIAVAAAAVVGTAVYFLVIKKK